jgi:hypothetical protein
MPMKFVVQFVHPRIFLSPSPLSAIIFPEEPENSFETPTNVVPKQEIVTGLSAKVRHEFPPHSITILRLHVPG